MLIEFEALMVFCNCSFVNDMPKIPLTTAPALLFAEQNFANFTNFRDVVK